MCTIRILAWILILSTLLECFAFQHALTALALIRGNDKTVLVCIVTVLVALDYRASRSVQTSLSSAEYEVMLTKVICQEAFLRAKGNLAGLTDSASLERDKSLKTVAQQLCSNGGTVQLHPLSYWSISYYMTLTAYPSQNQTIRCIQLCFYLPVIPQ